MEGTQREIGSSEIPFIQCNERQLPRDHLKTLNKFKRHIV